jgi:uncharacterized membrane protein YcaP (DUF421 family)
VDEAVEGRTEFLIKDGKIRRDRLRKELITISELEAAAHRQGFGSLNEVDCANIEPGGTISFVAKKPAPDEIRHKELLERFEKLSSELTQLRLSQQRPSA